MKDGRNSTWVTFPDRRQHDLLGQLDNVVPVAMRIGGVLSPLALPLDCGCCLGRLDLVGQLEHRVQGGSALVLAPRQDLAQLAQIARTVDRLE